MSMDPSNVLADSRPQKGRSWQYWLLLAFLLCVFFFGGSSRADTASLAALHPLSILVCMLALATLKRDHLRGRKMLLAGFGAMLLLTASHLVPLPPSVWHWLPERSIVADIDRLAQLQGLWRPFTFVPTNGWDATLSLFSPLAVILLGIQLNRKDLYRLLTWIIGLGALSGLFGLLQTLGNAESPLYLYRITNNGSAVGLFANRNHAAVFLACLFPMLAVFAAMQNDMAMAHSRRQVVAVSLAVVLLPLILITGSRSGLLLSIAGMICSVLLYRDRVKSHAKPGAFGFAIGRVPMLSGIILLSVGLVTVYFSRAAAIDRFFEQGAGYDVRGNFWRVSLDIMTNHYRLGSGSGSFPEIYQMVVPVEHLDTHYLNSAHNDWIESVVTLGIPGILLLSVAALFYLRKTFNIWQRSDASRTSVLFARMASLLIAIIAVASFLDYPLRTPLMMSFFAILALWYVEPGRATDMRVRH